MGALDRRLTIGIMLGAIVALIAWDIYAAASPGGGDTISEVTLAFSSRHLSVPFVVGGLLGHLFWPRHDPPPRRYTIPILVLACFAVIAWDWAGFRGLPMAIHRPAIAVLAGYPFGHVLWGQNVGVTHRRTR